MLLLSSLRMTASVVKISVVSVALLALESYAAPILVIPNTNSVSGAVVSVDKSQTKPNAQSVVTQQVSSLQAVNTIATQIASSDSSLNQITSSELSHTASSAPKIQTVLMNGVKATKQHSGHTAVICNH